MNDRPAQGLRERKKARTKALIQKEALRLFREKGYAATTVEQIAEAAEVAPSTVFRYFATKEDLILDDQFPTFIHELRTAPADLGPVAAMRFVVRTVMAVQSPEELAEGIERERLMFTVPELWAANLENIVGAVSGIRDVLAARAGRPPSDPEIRNVTGAILGVIMAVWLDWSADAELDGPAVLDEALAHLEAGLPLR
ncbi:TetR/AcrR family transcriptional regulator [Nonomuraea rhizosphaerae]|uniref:TetR/AcrR family transcriptional regulator n=1 Tax=Nonomuraea rhizosphaerae TaxID=2665663 RepID=UPI001C5E8100|nr:TetR family transcriptional regulator [Nonomuraea rhizosphaerae]